MARTRNQILEGSLGRRCMKKLLAIKQNLVRGFVRERLLQEWQKFLFDLNCPLLGSEILGDKENQRFAVGGREPKHLGSSRQACKTNRMGFEILDMNTKISCIVLFEF